MSPLLSFTQPSGHAQSALVVHVEYSWPDPPHATFPLDDEPELPDDEPEAPEEELEDEPGVPEDEPEVAEPLDEPLPEPEPVVPLELLVLDPPVAPLDDDEAGVLETQCPSRSQFCPVVQESLTWQFGMHCPSALQTHWVTSPHWASVLGEGEAEGVQLPGGEVFPIDPVVDPPPVAGLVPPSPFPDVAPVAAVPLLVATAPLVPPPTSGVVSWPGVQSWFTQLPVQQSWSVAQPLPAPAVALSGRHFWQSGETSQPGGQVTLGQAPDPIPDEGGAQDRARERPATRGNGTAEVRANMPPRIERMTCRVNVG